MVCVDLKAMKAGEVQIFDNLKVKRLKRNEWFLHRDGSEHSRFVPYDIAVKDIEHFNIYGRLPRCTESCPW